MTLYSIRRKMADKETKDLIRELTRQGFDVEPTKGSHYAVRKDGRRVTTLAGTGSDWRGRKNALAVLKRAGFQVR